MQGGQGEVDSSRGPSGADQPTARSDEGTGEKIRVTARMGGKLCCHGFAGRVSCAVLVVRVGMHSYYVLCICAGFCSSVDWPDP